MVRKSEGYSLLLLEVLIIFLNILAIVVILRFKRKYNPDILILSLAIADLLKALIPLNMTLYAYLSEKGMRDGSVSCIIFGWTAFTLNSGIMMVMTIMAVDRYIAMCWPFEYKRLLSKRRLIYIIVAAFFFSGIHSVLPLIGIGRMRPYNNGSFCHFDFDSTKPANRGYSIFILTLGISMILVVVFCYSCAMFSIRGLMQRQRRMSTSIQDVDGEVRKRQAMNGMFARLMIVMMVVFFVSWLLFLVVILQHVSGLFQIPQRAHFWSMRLAVVNSVLNPLIGAAMCKPYRRGYIFILCKFLHCCGLCSSYKADNPWMLSRRISQGSRPSSNAGPQTTKTNETMVKVKSTPSLSYQDSGILPDAGSIGYHQGGLINAAYDKEQSQAGTSFQEIQERPRLHRKRISFKDEMKADQAAMSLEEKEVAGSMVCVPDDTTNPQEEICVHSHQDTGQEPSYTQESSDENGIILFSEVDSSSSEFRHAATGVDTPLVSSKKTRKNAVSGYPFMSSPGTGSLDDEHLSPDPQGGESVQRNIATNEKAKQTVKIPITEVQMDYNHLSLSTLDVTQETFPEHAKGKKELSKEAKIVENSDDCLTTAAPKMEEAGLRTLLVTHFPVSLKCDIKTKVLSDSFSLRSSLPLSRSRSFLERTCTTSFFRTKLRSQSFDNKLTSSTKPFYETDSLTYWNADSTLRQRHSVVLAGEERVGIESHSERSDFTCFLPETALISPHGTPHTGGFRGHQAVGNDDPLSNNRIRIENGNRPQRKASDLDITSPSSMIYKELKELTSAELEGEVFF